MKENNNNEFENENEVKQEPNNKPNFDDFSYAKNAKKALIPMFVGLFTMVLLTVGATWAYYNIKLTSNITASTVSASTAKQSLVTASGTKQAMTLNLTAADMSDAHKNTTYYAKVNGKQTTAPNVTIATVTLSGNTTETVSCTATIKATHGTGVSLFSAYTGKSGTNANELILDLNGKTYDLATTDNNTAITGTTGLTNTVTFDLTSSSLSKTLYANFSLKNTTGNQEFLIDKKGDININTTVTCSHK